MAIEIRELIIKTEVVTNQPVRDQKLQIENLSRLKREILDQCKRMLTEGNKRNMHNR